MKRVGIFFVLLFILITPTIVKADSIEIKDYNIEVLIQENGNVGITEHIKLSQATSFIFKNNYLDCNGLNKIMYVGMNNDLYGSDIYVPKLNSEVTITDKDKNNINFTKEKTSLGEQYTIDNTDEIYVNYTFSNVIVSHRDISEFYYNFFRNKFDYNINKAHIRIELPKKSSYLKVTDYKYLNNIDITNNRIIKVDYTNPGKDINIRVVFDKNLVNTIKKTDNNIKDFIEEDINNKYVSTIKYYICVILTILFCLNFIRIVILIIVKYGTNKKYKITPNLDETLVKRYNYAGINYLINKDITTEAFVSGILDLINSGKLNTIKSESGKFALIRGSMSSHLSIEDDYLVKFLLDVIDKRSKYEKDLVSLEKIKQYCEDNTSISAFIVNFNVWKTIQVKNSREYRFMVGNEYYFSLKKSLVFSYIILILNIICKTNFVIGIVAFIPVTLLVNIMIKLTKRSTMAEEVYKEVINLKEGLKKFGPSTRDPHRWDMLLINAVSMGIGVEVENMIKEKIKNGTLVEHYDSNLINTYRMYPTFSIVKDLLPVFKTAYKKSFFIYTAKRKNNL